MSRTRSDFLTRAPIVSHGGDTDEDDYDADSPMSPLSPRHYTLPLSKQSSTEAGLQESCFSDSDMVTMAPSEPAVALFTLLKRVFSLTFLTSFSRDSVDLHHTSDSD